jgi:hypothetical protein
MTQVNCLTSRRNVLRLVPARPDPDLVEALQILLEGAQAGEITGLAFAATIRGHGHISNVAGSCLLRLTHARGMLATLSDKLGDMIDDREKYDGR